MAFEATSEDRFCDARVLSVPAFSLLKDTPFPIKGDDHIPLLEKPPLRKATSPLYVIPVVHPMPKYFGKILGKI